VNSNAAIEAVKYAKYLRITLSNNLECGHHLDIITKKASNTLNFVRRNLKHCPWHCKGVAYFTLVRSTVEYGSAVWDPRIKKWHWQARENQSASCTNDDERLRVPLQQCHCHDEASRVANSWTPTWNPAPDHDVQGCSRPSGSVVHTTYSCWSTHQSKSSVQVQEHFNQPTPYKFSFFPRTIPSWNKQQATGTSRDGQRSNTRLVQESHSPIPWVAALIDIFGISHRRDMPMGVCRLHPRTRFSKFLHRSTPKWLRNEIVIKDSLTPWR